MRLKTLKVKLNCLPNKLECFGSCFPNSNTPGKIGNISTKTIWAFFNDDGVFHLLILLQPSLFLNAFQSTGRNFHTEFTSDSYSARFMGMLELAMASFNSDLPPTLNLELLDNGFNFHLAFFNKAVVI